MQMVAMGNVGMMPCLFMATAYVVLGCFFVMAGCMFMMLRRFGMMFCAILADLANSRVCFHSCFAPFLYCNENVTWSPFWLPRLWQRRKTLKARYPKNPYSHPMSQARRFCCGNSQSQSVCKKADLLRITSQFHRDFLKNLHAPRIELCGFHRLFSWRDCPLPW
jgi:hypothetical protein